MQEEDDDEKTPVSNPSATTTAPATAAEPVNAANTKEPWQERADDKHDYTASMWRRLFASWVDAFILQIIMTACLAGFLFLLYKIEILQKPTSKDLPLDMIVVLVVSTLIFIFFYDYLFLIFKDATPGKMLLKLLVVDHTTSKNRFPRACPWSYGRYASLQLHTKLT